MQIAIDFVSFFLYELITIEYLCIETLCITFKLITFPLIRPQTKYHT